jgi:thiamine biosynthesis lipoprotein
MNIPARIFLFLLVASTLVSCTKETYRFNEGTIFGTLYHFTYLADKDLQLTIETELNRFDAELSMFNPNSTLSRINKHDTTRYNLNPHPWVLRVIQKSLEYSALSDGAFDITVAPLVNAWGFGFSQSAVVTQPYLDSLLNFVGYKRLSLTNGYLSKSDSRIQLDASAVAKGYACDVVAEVLEKHGVRNYLVEIGGEMVLKGTNPNGTPWRVGINTPEDDSTSANLDWSEKLTLTDCSVATSGNYRRFYIKDGKRYAHTIDPISGYPVQHSLLSATVVAEDCLTADALATAFMVMGVEKATALAERLPEVEALFICAGDNGALEVSGTSGIKKFQD